MTITIHWLLLDTTLLTSSRIGPCVLVSWLKYIYIYIYKLKVRAAGDHGNGMRYMKKVIVVIYLKKYQIEH